MNIGEELVAAYLQHIKGCEFTQQNLYTDVQGEIDVVGINLAEQTVYVCEVAIHLSTGLQYTKGNRPNNVDKLTEKFLRDIDYAKKYFKAYQHHRFMLWSPIVRKSKEHAKWDQERDLNIVKEQVFAKRGETIELVVNDSFRDRLKELRDHAGSKTEELKNPVLRLFQIEEALNKHLARSAKRAIQ